MSPTATLRSALAGLGHGWGSQRCWRRQVWGTLLFVLWQHLRNRMCKSSATVFLSSRGKGGCPAHAPPAPPLAVEAIPIRNSACVCPTSCFYAAPRSTTCPQCSCWIAVGFAAESPLAEEVRAVGDWVMRIEFCLYRTLLRNSSKNPPNMCLLWTATLCTSRFSAQGMAGSGSNSAACVSPWWHQQERLRRKLGLTKKLVLFSHWCYKSNILQIISSLWQECCIYLNENVNRVI